MSMTKLNDYSAIKTSKRKKNFFQKPKNKSDKPTKQMQEFIGICKMSQMQLKKWLQEELKKYYAEVESGKGFIFAKGKDPVLVVAHMDTVHQQPPKEVFIDKGVISSPQGIGGDDRCGIYTILEICKDGLRPFVLFAEDEEVGGVGTQKFITTKHVDSLDEVKFAIEIDRKGNNELVFYEDDNEQFHDWVGKILPEWKEDIGSFTDICYISPKIGASSVNLSSGYYNAHTTSEYVVFKEMVSTKEAVETLIKEACLPEVKKFEYIERPKQSWYGGGNLWASMYDNFDNWSHYTSKATKKASSEELKDNFCDVMSPAAEAYIKYVDATGVPKSEIETGLTAFECIGKFFVDHPNITYNDLTSLEIETNGKVVNLL